MKTAVEWLKLEIESIEFQDPAAGQLYLEIQPLIEQAKEMEKEQIKDAWLNSLTKGDYNSAEQYYNETFKSE